MKILRIGSLRGSNCTRLENIQEVRRFVETYFKEINENVIIGDLSMLSREALSVLLKFIEEGVEDIICFASRDNVNPVLMSRFDRIESMDDIKIGMNGFDYFLKHIDEREKIDCIEREFLTKAGDQLDTFLLYSRLERSVIARVGQVL